MLVLFDGSRDLFRVQGGTKRTILADMDKDVIFSAKYFPGFPYLFTGVHNPKKDYGVKTVNFGVTFKGPPIVIAGFKVSGSPPRDSHFYAQGWGHNPGEMISPHRNMRYKHDGADMVYNDIFALKVWTDKLNFACNYPGTYYLYVQGPQL